MADTAAATVLGPHGAKLLPSVEVDNYNLELKDDEGFIGDRASRQAFHSILENWRKPLRKLGADPFGDTPSDDLSRPKLDVVLRGRPRSRRRDPERDRGLRAGACGRHAALSQGEGLGRHRAHCDGRRFSREPHRRARDRRADLVLKADGIKVDMMPIHNDPDEAALLGSLHLAPAWIFKGHDSILAIDIGGTNIRAGVVLPNVGKASDLSESVGVEIREVAPRRRGERQPREPVDELIGMLQDLIKRAKKEGYDLAPFIGIACPGKIELDGSIAKGAQNLPGNWESSQFNLPARLAEAIPSLGDHDVTILMHNDAVVQGLSEIPFMQDVKRWGVLTIGTGLGNARFTNRASGNGSSKE